MALVSVVALVAALVSCGGGAEQARDGCVAAEPERLTPQVRRTLAHASDAYTQGLVFLDGRLYESTGLVGQSTLRELDPDSGEVVRSTPVDPEVFAEGLAVGAEDRLVQLTWTDGIAYEWDAEDLTVVRTFSYRGEGWGLTALEDGSLVMSDGSDVLVERDPQDFSVVDSRRVTRVGGDADLLNELEWDGEHIWANRYQTDEIVRIDSHCATVTAVVDVSDLARRAARAAAADEAPIGVSNGIAHVAGTDRYLLTGKNWPAMYEVTLEP